jgi:hypothetical protein
MKSMSHYNLGRFITPFPLTNYIFQNVYIKQETEWMPVKKGYEHRIEG